MDPQIGTDIAKLLGNLGKSKVQSGSSASGSEAGAAFKSALVASEQAQGAVTGGKGLPAASASTTPSQEPNDPPVAGSVASMHLAERVSTKSLPGFDLHVVGEPAERLAVMKYAERVGLSPEVLAQLFPATDRELADPSVQGRSLADAVATAIAAWLATNQTQESGSAQIDVESLDQLIAPMLAKVTAEGDAQGAASSVNLATQITASLQALVSSRPGADQVTQNNDLLTRIREVVTSAVAQWAAGSQVDVMAQGEYPTAEVAVKELANRITQLITATLSESQHDASVAVANPARADLTSASEGTVLRTPGLTAELESAVARWVAQSPISTGNAVPEQWVRDTVQRVAPEAAQWRADTESVDRSAQQLSAQIAPELIKAIQAFTENPLRSPAAAVAQQVPASTTAPLATIPAMLGGASELEISALRANVVSQPQPIALAIAGAQSDAVQPAPQNLASALAQVMAPNPQPISEAAVLPQAATLDRFALRGVNVTTDNKAEITKTDATVAAEVVKGAKADPVMALRDLVSARSLELARLAAASDKPAVTSATQPTPFAGLVQGDVSFRQALTGSDRSALSDAARLNQFTPNQNLAARELAGRQLSEALGQRLAANIAAGHYRLTFNVHPRELGAIDVVMEMRDGRLDAQINTSNAVTRELLGDSLPRLRDALQQSGVNLAHLNVGSDTQQGQSQGREASTNNTGAQDQDKMSLAHAGSDTVSEDLELGLDLDSIDFWA